jgi:hypothetical protein
VVVSALFLLGEALKDGRWKNDTGRHWHLDWGTNSSGRRVGKAAVARITRARPLRLHRRSRRANHDEDEQRPEDWFQHWFLLVC